MASRPRAWTASRPSTLSSSMWPAVISAKSVKCSRRDPYLLGGYCLGGTIRDGGGAAASGRGESIGLVAMIENFNIKFDALAAALEPADD